MSNKTDNGQESSCGMTAADTCRRTAAIRALASEDPSLPYREPYASMLAGSKELERTKGIRDNYESNSVPGVVIRSMMIDQWLQEHQDEFEQIVVLGAGMDTRTYRLDLKNIKWFEVDEDEVISLKEAILAENRVDLANDGRVARLKLDLAVDLDSLFPSLEQEGFRRESPTVYVLEGLLYYIPKDGVKALLKALSIIPKSRILLTMIDEELLQCVRTYQATDAKLAKIVGQLSNLWKSSMSDLLEVLGPWSIQNQATTTDEEWVKKLCPGSNVSKGFPKGTENVITLA